MKLSTWLAQLHSISHGLLFAQGHISSAETALSLRSKPVTEEAESDASATGSAPPPVRAACPAAC